MKRRFGITREVRISYVPRAYLLVLAQSETDKCLAVFQINNDPNILPDVNLVMRWNDTRGETVESTNAMIDMICDGVVAFFGPEGSCFVEATVAQARNLPMISYVSESQVFT